VIKALVLGITLLSCLALSTNLHPQSGSGVQQQIKQLQQEPQMRK
jgi:hypothetical protein